MSAAPERVSRQQQDAAERAQAAQMAAQTARFARLEQHVRRTVNGLFMLMAALWLIALAVIVGWEFTQWHR